MAHEARKRRHPTEANCVAHSLHLNWIALLSSLSLLSPSLPLFVRPISLSPHLHTPHPLVWNSSFTMIRSNPTAIPLRPSDLKLLQAELDARRAERERDAAAASGSANAANTSTAAASSRHKSNTSISTKTNGANGSAAAATSTPAPAPGDHGVDERRRRRAHMTAQERIGM